MPESDRTATVHRAPRACALPALVLAAVLAAPSAAAADPSPDRVSLLSGSEVLRVVTADERIESLPLEPGVRFGSVTAVADGWIAAGVRDSKTLLLVRSERGETSRMTVPSAGGGVALDPEPLVADGDLVGLAWLAGGGVQGLAVLYSEWLGGGWGPSEVVADPGAGSQLALAWTITADAEPLLAWSAFDGSDDEIVWSVRRRGSWTTPERLGEDNWVPDITPALARVDGGVVAAWSRYVGDGYRMMVSRLGDDGWSAPEPFAPVGSVFPRFESRAEEEGTLLLYRDARSGSWTVLQLDRHLRTTARASVEGSGADDPVVLESGPDSVHVIPGPDRPAVRVPWSRP